VGDEGGGGGRVLDRVRVVAHRRYRLASIGVTDPSFLWAFSPASEGEGMEGEDEGEEGRGRGRGRGDAGKKKIGMESWEVHLAILEHLGRSGAAGAPLEEVLSAVLNEGQALHYKNPLYFEGMSRVRFLQQKEFVFMKKAAGEGLRAWLNKYADVVDRQEQLAIARLSLRVAPLVPEGVWPAEGTSAEGVAFSMLPPPPSPSQGGGEAVGMEVDEPGRGPGAGNGLADPPAWAVRIAVGDNEEARSMDRECCECVHALLLHAGMMREDALVAHLDRLIPASERLSQYGKGDLTKATLTKQSRRHWLKVRELLESGYGVQFVLAKAAEDGKKKKKNSLPVSCAQLSSDHFGLRKAEFTAGIASPVRGEHTLALSVLLILLRMGSLSSLELAQATHVKLRRMVSNQQVLSELMSAKLLKFENKMIGRAKHQTKVFRLSDEGLQLLEDRGCQGDLHMLQFIAALKQGEHGLPDLEQSDKAKQEPVQDLHSSASAIEKSRQVSSLESQTRILGVVKRELAEHGYCTSTMMGSQFFEREIGWKVTYKTKMVMFDKLVSEKGAKMFTVYLYPKAPAKDNECAPMNEPAPHLLLMPWGCEPETVLHKTRGGKEVNLWVGDLAESAGWRLHEQRKTGASADGERITSSKRRVKTLELVDAEAPTPLPLPVPKSARENLEVTGKVEGGESHHPLKDYYIPAVMVRAKLMHIFLLHASVHAGGRDGVDWSSIKFPPLGGGTVAGLPDHGIDDPPFSAQFRHTDFRGELEEEISVKLGIDVQAALEAVYGKGKRPDLVKLSKRRVVQDFPHFLASSEGSQATDIVQGDREVDLVQMLRTLPDNFRAHLIPLDTFLDARTSDDGENQALDLEDGHINEALQVLVVLGLVRKISSAPKSQWLCLARSARVGSESPSPSSEELPDDVTGAGLLVPLQFGHRFDLYSQAGLLAYWRCMEDATHISLDLMSSFEMLHNKVTGMGRNEGQALTTAEAEHKGKIARFVAPYPVGKLPEQAFAKMQWHVQLSCPPLRDAFNADVERFLVAALQSKWGSSGKFPSASFTGITSHFAFKHGISRNPVYQSVRERLTNIREGKIPFSDPPEESRNTPVWKSSVEASRHLDETRYELVNSRANRKENFTGLDDCVLVVSYNYIRALARCCGLLNEKTTQMLSIYLVPALQTTGRRPIQTVRRYGILSRDARFGRVCTLVAKLGEQFALRIFHRGVSAAELRGEDPPYCSPAGLMHLFDAAVLEVGHICTAVAEGKLLHLLKRLGDGWTDLTTEELEWAPLALVLEPMGTREHENYRGTRKTERAERRKSGKRRSRVASAEGTARRSRSRGAPKSKRPGNQFCDIPAPEVEIGDDMEGLVLIPATQAGYVSGTPSQQPWKSKAALDWKFDANMGREMLEAERKYDESPEGFVQRVETPGDAMYALCLAFAGSATLEADVAAMAARARKGKSTAPGEAAADGCVKIRPKEDAGPMPRMARWADPARKGRRNPVPGHRSTWDEAMRAAFHAGVSRLCSEPFIRIEDFLGSLEAVLSSHNREALAVGGEARRILRELVKEDLAIVSSRRRVHDPSFLSCTPPQPIPGRRQVCVRSSSRTLLWLSCT